jgi:Domain of unknown function (DUF4440)
MNRRIFLSVAAMTAVADRLFAGQAAAGKEEENVRQAERARFAAMVKADVGALDKLLAPELIYTHGDARRIDKAAFISDFKTGAFKYVTIEPSEMNVRVYGDVAVVTGAAAMHVVQDGKDAHIRIRYTNTHVRRGGAWQMVAWQATRIPQP